jgi:hypothetical protein
MMQKCDAALKTQKNKLIRSQIGGLFLANRRAVQLRLAFPLSFQQITEFHPLAPKGATLRDRQPSKFPRGWFARSLEDPNWREAHYAEWSAKRKAAGLPHVVKGVA